MPRSSHASSTPDKRRSLQRVELTTSPPPPDLVMVVVRAVSVAVGMIVAVMVVMRFGR
jgi:hypothetical protein